MTHSPAPWRTKELLDYQLIYDAEGNRIHSDNLSPSDAALIAAAPELLEACKEIYALLKEREEQTKYYEHSERFIDETMVLKSAIAKAEPK